MKTKVIGNLKQKGRLESACRIYDSQELSPTLNSCNGGGHEPKIIDKPVLVGGVGLMKSNNNTQYYQQDRIYDTEAVALCESANEQFNPWYNQGLRIRKLTPKECTRLMGFTDEDYEAMAKVNSSSQIYKQCGNSIVVQVLEGIFKELL